MMRLFRRTQIEQESGMTRNTKLILGIGIPVLAVVAILLPFFHVNQVVSASMDPTVKTGDNVFYTSMFPQEVSRGQIILFRDGWGWFANSPEMTDPANDLIMKRVIAVGGDTISSDGNNVFVNGQVIDEPYAYGTTGAFKEQTIPPRTLFVMGDNRSESSDSRAHINDGYAFVPIDWVEDHYLFTLYNSPLPGTGNLCKEGHLEKC